MTTTYKTVTVNGYSNKNTVFFIDGKFYEVTSYDLTDYDVTGEIEKQLDWCRKIIEENENNNGWISGNVTCYLDVHTFDDDE